MPLRLTSWMRSQSAGLDVEEFHRLGNAGVVDQNVDLAEGADNGFNGFRTRTLVGDVARNPDMCLLSGLLETLGSGERCGAIDIKDCNARTFFRKPSGGREANSARRGRSCNNCRFAA